MRQLGELKQNAEKFQSLNTEVIAVFREEEKGVEGLEIIKEKTGTPFTLALDTGKAKTGRYSPGKGEFSTYVIDAKGSVRGIIIGDLRNRAKSDELLKTLEQIAHE